MSRKGAETAHSEATVSGQKPKWNYKKQECFGNYGYGNGRTRKDFCNDTCPLSRKCWRKTITVQIPLFYPPHVVLRYEEVIRKWYKRYPENHIKARRLAMKEMIDKEMCDPYLELVVRNTQKGIEDSPPLLLQFKGAVYFYHGAIVAYHAARH